MDPLQPLPLQPPSPPTRARQRRFCLAQSVAGFFLTLVVVAGVAALTVWLVLRPRQMVYSVVSADIQNYTLTSTNRLTAAFNITLQAYNPNSRASVYYDVVRSELFYDDKVLAAADAEPFFQPRRNITDLHLFLHAQDVALNSYVATDLKIERTNGKVELKLRVHAKIKFKVGVWKSDHRKLKVQCFVTVPFASKAYFDPAYCDVDL